MADVKAFDRLGNRITIPESDVPALEKMGGRVATATELAEHDVQARYDATPGGVKALGAVNTAIGIATGNPLLIGNDANAPPTVAAYGAGVRKGMSAGLSDAATRTIIDAAAGKDAGAKFAEQRAQEEAASPYATGAGELAGVIGGSALGSGSGAATKALPAAGITALGDVAEAGAAKLVGGLATRGTLGKAAAAAAKLGVRGAVEGAAFEGVNEAANQITDDTKSGERLYTAIGHGALTGGAAGAGLGGIGSIASSGYGRLSRRIARSLRAETQASERIATESAAPIAHEVPAITQAELDAGLHERPPAAEGVFSFGPEKREVFLRPGGRPGASKETPFSIGRSVTIDPDAGLFAPKGGKEETPIFSLFNQGTTRDARRAAVEKGLFEGAEKGHETRLAGDLFRKPQSNADLFRKGELASNGKPLQHGFDIRFDPDAGIEMTSKRTLREIPIDDIEFRDAYNANKTKRVAEALDSGKQMTPPRITMREDGKYGIQDGIHRIAEARKRGAKSILASVEEFVPKVGELEDARPAFRVSSAKDAPRDVGLKLPGDELAPIETKAPIRLPEVPPAPKPLKVDSIFSDPSNAARSMAQEQAWRSIGAGYGLQTSRYAHEARRYFGDTSALGEVALRYDLIDVPKTGGPLEAAWQAAKTGTPAHIQPKAELALESVGKQIGEITDASGARVSRASIEKVIDDVAREYEGKASQLHIGRAVREYGDDLRSVLRFGADDKVSLQDILHQRRALSETVYRESKALDPKLRVGALRDVNGKLEGLIADELDAASSQVPGELKKKYAQLKRDYHALRIIQEAAEDSATRASKNSMLGLGEKIAVGTALASGHLTAAPILALGGKVLFSRGNAAAAAFLSRAADTGTAEAIMKRVNAAIDSAAKGVISDAGAAPRLSARTNDPTGKRQAIERADAREGRRKIVSDGQAIAAWVAKTEANPDAFLRSIEDSAPTIARAAGPRAATGYTMSALRAYMFIKAYVPVKERRDPLDPSSVPPLTYDEANRLVRATTYAVHPASVWSDFRRGKVTPEALAAANAFMPDQFAAFQVKLQDHVADLLMHDKRLTQSQRLRVDKLLGIGDLSPDKMSALQRNFAPVAPEEPPPGPTNGPLNLKIQQTGFDSVEARRSAS